MTVLVGLLRRMEDFDEIAMFGEEQIDRLRRILPFANGNYGDSPLYDSQVWRSVGCIVTVIPRFRG